MKVPKEFEQLPSIEVYLDDVWGKDKMSLKETMDMVKKDAWNAAIRWAVENVEIEEHSGCETYSCLNEQSILNGLIND